MKQIQIRNTTPADYPRIVELNDTEVQQTSAMDVAKLSALADMSCYHKVAVVDGQIAAFLLAMPENVAYQSENYVWFAARFPQFIYVDRIVVSAEFSGLKIGSLLYQDLFSMHARKALRTSLANTISSHRIWLQKAFTTSSASSRLTRNGWQMAANKLACKWPRSRECG